MCRNAESNRTPSKVARGYRRSTGSECLRRIVISLDDETFETVSGIAQKRGKSFASVARELIEFGLIDTEGAN